LIYFLRQKLSAVNSISPIMKKQSNNNLNGYDKNKLIITDEVSNIFYYNTTNNWYFINENIFIENQTNTDNLAIDIF